MVPQQIARLAAILLLALGCGSSPLVAKEAATSDKAFGFSEEEPSSGPVVAADKGYMVGYSRTIPGTEVEYHLQAIPGGKFTMGSPADEPGRKQDEGPQVEVQVEPFWMGRTEVTWAEYKQFMQLCTAFEKFDDLGIRQLNETNQVDAVTAPSKLYEPSFTFESGEAPKQPAVSMSQYATKQYCKWLSLITGEFYRLPTEAEWEYACRAGSKSAYSFGSEVEELDKYGWYLDTTDWVTAKVATRKPNAWGLYDMHGNVWEWTHDQYAADHYQAFADKSHDASQLVHWPTKLFPRVLRGGSWDSEPVDCRSAARLASDDDEWRSYDPNSPKSPWWFASEMGQTIGFRIVRPLDAPEPDERAKYWDADEPEIQAHVDRRIDKEGRGERGLADPSLPAAIKNNVP